MQIFDDLRAEHERIESVLGSFRTWADRYAHGDASRDDLQSFLFFFRTYAGEFHHEREEELIVPALVNEAQLPRDRGPIAILLDDHAQMAATLAKIEVSVDAAETRTLAVAYSHALWAHIDMENSVFFPESERQLQRNFAAELTSREINERESEAIAIGDLLVAKYPPSLPDAIRGEGCVMCIAYGDTCRGLEREWWNEWEWEEMDEHVAAS